MSRLQELLEELCPDGVEYRCLKDITISLKKGTLKTDEVSKTKNSEYCFPVINSGRDLYGYYTEYNNEYGITIAARGEYAGFVSYFDKKFWAGGLSYPYVSIDESVILTKFIYYCLKYKEKLFRNKLVSEGSIPALNKGDIDKHKLPVPPLEVQREIVRVLDSFTLLLDELTDELTARKKQYNEYLNKLISSENIKNGTEYALGELFDFRNGLSKGKEFFGHGIPFIRYTDVYNNRFLHKCNVTALVECTDAEKSKLRVSRGDVLFTRTSETAEDVGWSSVMLDDMDDCVFNGFTIKATPKTELVLPEYCAYCFSTKEFRNYVASHCAFTTRASLTGTTIGDYKIVIPDLDTQKRIVEILDKFYLITNDISNGIPAEIESRKKQYEYYRDKLLSFKEKEVV